LPGALTRSLPPNPSTHNDVGETDQDFKVMVDEGFPDGTEVAEGTEGVGAHDDPGAHTAMIPSHHEQYWSRGNNNANDIKQAILVQQSQDASDPSQVRGRENLQNENK